MSNIVFALICFIFGGYMLYKQKVMKLSDANELIPIMAKRLKVGGVLVMLIGGVVLLETLSMFLIAN